MSVVGRDAVLPKVTGDPIIRHTARCFVETVRAILEPARARVAEEADLAGSNAGFLQTENDGRGLIFTVEQACDSLGH